MFWGGFLFSHTLHLVHYRRRITGTPSLHYSTPATPAAPLPCTPRSLNQFFWVYRCHHLMHTHTSTRSCCTHFTMPGPCTCTCRSQCHTHLGSTPFYPPHFLHTPASWILYTPSGHLFMGLFLVHFFFAHLNAAICHCVSCLPALLLPLPALRTPTPHCPLFASLVRTPFAFVPFYTAWIPTSLKAFCKQQPVHS